MCSVQFSSFAQLCPTLCDPMNAALQVSLSIINSQSLPKLMSIESMMPSSHLILFFPLLLLPPIPPSIMVFSNESNLRMRWPKYWRFSFIISPFNEHRGQISSRMNWLDLFAVQGTLKSLLQHHSSKASILCCSAFFTVQLSHPYITTGKTIALTRWTSVGKVLSLLFPVCSTSHREGNGTPLQCSCLENLMDGGAWWAAFHGVTKSWTQLSNFTFTFHFHALEKEMATHSSVLA